MQLTNCSILSILVGNIINNLCVEVIFVSDINRIGVVGAGQMGNSVQSKVTGASASPFQQAAGLGLQGLSSIFGGLF